MKYNYLTSEKTLPVLTSENDILEVPENTLSNIPSDVGCLANFPPGAQ